MSKVRVLHYIGNQGMTGVEVFVLALAAAQRKLGLDAAITCHPKGRDELLKKAKALGIPVFLFVQNRPPPSGLARKLSRIILANRRVLNLTRLLRAEAFDVLHIHPVGIAGLPAFISCLLARTRVLITTHHTALSYAGVVWSKRNRLAFALERKFAQAIVMPYEAAGREMRATCSRDYVHVVPFCVDPQRFAAGPRVLRENGPLRLLLSARLVEGKGHIELLRALVKLRERGVNVVLDIAGDGPMRNPINTMIGLLKLEGIVRVLGYIDNDRAPSLLREADVMVLPSYMPGETFPISLLEAAMMGVPAIGTRWFGIPDIIVDGETGILVEPRDIEGLALAIERCAHDRQSTFTMGTRALARAERFFTTDAVAAAYLKLYR